MRIPTAAELRIFAAANGIECAPVGVIPDRIRNAWREAHNMQDGSAVMPDRYHRHAAARLIDAHREGGSEAVLALADELHMEDVPLVFSALAGMARRYADDLRETA